MHRFCIVLAVLTSATTISASSHATVIYDEAVGGDLPKIDLPPLPDFTLEEGENEVKGTLVPPADEDDSFRILVPPHLRLDDIKVDQRGTPDDETGYINEFVFVQTNPDESEWDYVIWRIEGNTPSGGTSLKDTPPVQIEPGPIEDILPFIPSPDPYIFSIKTNKDPSYTVTFILSPIPEPTSLGLLTLGSVALMRPRRRTC